MIRYNEGDWLKYRHRGMVLEGKLLEIRPDDFLVVGEHDNDPSPTTIEPSDVITKIT